MEFKLPRLTWDLDCGPLGYAGLVFHLTLNPPLEEYQPPWAGIEDEKQREKARKAAPGWENEYYWSLGRIVAAVSVPGEFAANGLPATVELGSAMAVWELERAPGFDPQVVQWALRQYAEQRQERIRLERKN